MANPTKTYQFVLSDHAYAYLGSMLDHPHRRKPHQEYTGWGMATVGGTNYTTHKGLGQYLNNIAHAAPHPSEYDDMRDAAMPTRHEGLQAQGEQSRYYYLNPAHLQAIPRMNYNNYGRTEDHERYEEELKYKSHIPAYLLAAVQQAQPPAPYFTRNVVGPCNILLSPYSLEYWGQWSLPIAVEQTQRNINTYITQNSYIDPQTQEVFVPSTPPAEARVRMLKLEPNTIAYFAHVGRWWRIPPRTHAITYRTGKQAGHGRNTETQMAAACLEAIGLGYLAHPLIVKQPITKHNDYKRKPTYVRGEGYEGPPLDSPPL